MKLQTDRLELIAIDAEIALAAVDDRNKLSELICAEVPDAWPPETMRDVMHYFAATLAIAPNIRGYWVWYIILRENVQDNSKRVLIGSTGFRGKPTRDGALTLGYSLTSEYEGRGYTTEAARALISWAFKQPGVNEVIAETYTDHMASIRVMEKAGMTFWGQGSEENLVRYSITK